MNKKYLYKALCLLAALTVHQANAALLTNPVGPGYNVIDNCYGCSGITDINVNIENNIPIELTFDPLSALFENININLINITGAAWSNLTIEYNTIDPYASVQLGLSVLDTGGSTATIDEILSNSVTGAPSGLALSFAPPESSFVNIVGSANRTDLYNLTSPYSITISTSAVPVPAAVWLFGSGLIGLMGFARRKKYKS